MVDPESTPPFPALLDARVLVVGGGGYIASRLIQRLNELGVRPFVQSARPDSIQHLDFEHLFGSPTDPEIAAAMRELQPEYVLDLAGRTDQSQGRDVEADMMESHFGLAHTTARAVIGPSLKRWVRCGTNEEYGHNAVPHIESQRESPITSYSSAKVAVTHYLQMLALTENVPVTIVRPFLVYGPGQGRGFLPFLIRTALADETFETTEGTQTRDFIYVDDVVSGVLSAAVADDVNGEVFNLGTGIETPVRDVVEAVCRIAGSGKPIFGAMPLRESELLRSVADITKAQTRLNWSPVTSIEQGIAQMIDAAKMASTP